MPSAVGGAHESFSVSPVEKKQRRFRSAVILASFVVLFGGGVVVYGVAWGAPGHRAPASSEAPVPRAAPSLGGALGAGVAAPVLPAPSR